MLKLRRLAAPFYGCFFAAYLSTPSIAENHENSRKELQGTQRTEDVVVPLEVKFSRAFGVPADGSWDGLFSPDNVLDPVRYATGAPVKTIFKSGQYALSSTTAGSEIWYGTAASVWCYWPYISMAMPLQLMNHETPNHGCQITPPSGQRPTAQIYFHNVKSGKSTHVGPATIVNGQKFWEDSLSLVTQRSYIEAMLSMPGYTYRGAGTIDNLTFFAGSNEVPVRKLKKEWLDTLPAEQRAVELKKFPADFDFEQDGNIGYNRIFVFDNKRKEYLGFAEFFFDTVRRFQTVTHPDGSRGLYWFGGPDQSGNQNGNSLNAMLRWVGTPTEPLSGGMLGNGFDIVSDSRFEKFGVVGDFREFTVEGKKHFISSSWYNPYGEPAAMLVSNAMPGGGYSSDRPVVYQVIMRYTDYDPEQVGGHGSKFAANEFFGEYLYFGSYHQGTSGAYEKIMRRYCDEEAIESLCKLADYQVDDIEAHREFMMKTWRAASIFRIKIADLLSTDTPVKDKVQLLYGKEQDWVFVPTKSPGSPRYNAYRFELQDNRLGQVPLFGDEGFGHQGMVYTFTFVEHDGKLFLGSWNSTAGLFDMFDHREYSFWNHRALFLFGLPLPLAPFGRTDVIENNPAYFLYQQVVVDAELNGYSLDEANKGWLMVFEDTESPAVLFRDGFGNPCNNGVRNYAKVGGELYMGTTSWCNLGENSGLEYYKYEGSNR